MKLEHSSLIFLKLDYFDFFLLFDFQEIMSRRKQKTEKERQEKARLNLLSLFFETFLKNKEDIFKKYFPLRGRRPRSGEMAAQRPWGHKAGRRKKKKKRILAGSFRAMPHRVHLLKENGPKRLGVKTIKNNLLLKKINLIFNS